MGTTSLTREQLNEAIEQFANKITEALGATVTDEAAGEPELTGTHFKAIDLDGDQRVMDAVTIEPGTLVTDGPFEYFRCGDGFGGKPWVRYNGRALSHEEFAAEMRDINSTPRIAHQG